MLKGKVSLVTGGDSETSQAIAAALAAAGSHVAVCGEAGERSTGAGSSGGQAFKFFEGKITEDAGAGSIVDAVVRGFGRLDVLVNYGAARRITGTIADIAGADFDEEMAADLKSTICLSRAAVLVMAKGGGGAIVNLSSIAASGVKGRALRSASKGALNALTCAMALDHGPDNIRVNAVLMGPTLTADLQRRPEQVSGLAAEAPLGRLHTTEDVANLVLFLASDNARSITGALIPLDAGRSLPRY